MACKGAQEPCASIGELVLLAIQFSCHFFGEDTQRTSSPRVTIVNRVRDHGAAENRDSQVGLWLTLFVFARFQMLGCGWGELSVFTGDGET